jgi:molybdopterin/thiamine biosynthesis adenylyltransferase
MLTPQDRERYQRQMLYDDFGEDGQRRLKRSHVVVAGAGGLGCPAATYLACAGIGHITLVDHEVVDLSNLNRQILHWDDNIGEKKVASAAGKLARLNPSITVVPIVARITDANAKHVIRDADAVLDATDSFDARYVLNQACLSEGIPLVHGGVWGLCGQVTTILPGQTPCFSCIYPEEPEGHRPLPVFGVAPGLIAVIQAAEVIKIVAGFGRLLAGQMLYVNESTMDFCLRELTRNPNCKVCGDRKGLTH